MAALRVFQILMSVLMKTKLSVISYVLILMEVSYVLALKAMSLWKKLTSVKVDDRIYFAWLIVSVVFIFLT